ncbi:hypothetical protein LKM2_3493 [Leptospira kirschneri serovar Mozdok]|nr:hypothetical protein [Leptospira kirschneri serovar Mozdok]
MEDSSIVLPIIPVRRIPPFPLTKSASIRSVAPPTEVQAKPRAVPGTEVRTILSFVNLGTPKKVSRSFSRMILGNDSFRTILIAILRTNLSVTFSKPLTPDSLE